jgi:2-keto-4-pentenoate hydratase
MTATGDDRVRRGMATQLEARRRALEGGAESLGWKIGLNVAAAQKRAGISAPVVGFLTDATRLPSGATYAIGGGTKVVVEPEVAVRLAAALGAEADREQASGAIASLAPALEVVDMDRDIADIEAVLAGDIFHRAVVLGEESAARSLEGVVARVSRAGREEERVEAAQATGDVVDVVLHVARFLAAHGAALQAGEVIICGAMTAPLPARAGEAIALHLGPLGGVEVQIAA